MFFSGGTVPYYLIIVSLKLFNNFLVYIIPSLFSVYNMLVFSNFFRGIPEEIRESAVMDGASEFKIFTSIILPLSMPVVSTVGLWIAVGHWNSFYDTMLYTTDTNLWTLQYYLMKVIKESSGSFIAGMPAEMIGNISAETVSCRYCHLGNSYLGSLSFNLQDVDKRGCNWLFKRIESERKNEN